MRGRGKLAHGVVQELEHERADGRPHVVKVVGALPERVAQGQRASVKGQV